MKPIPRLTMSEVCEQYHLSRWTVEKLINQGHLTAEQINGKGRRYFRVENIEGLFRTYRPPSSQSDFNLKQIADETYAQVFGAAPTNARIH